MVGWPGSPGISRTSISPRPGTATNLPSGSGGGIGGSGSARSSRRQNWRAAVKEEPIVSSLSQTAHPEPESRLQARRPLHS